ncbi:hypothetical protein ACFFVB_09320 [Formosa undariae]|uniref:Uncharacterized protein n=1 Tax=Formosa undariae TaxID=1325436 RepID=A0ABV5F1H0_9FLAO
MKLKILKLINNTLTDADIKYADVIPWSTPIYSFGSISNSKIATLGINPSNREFEDLNGIELNENNRRFHTLKSLNINNWTEIDNTKTNSIKTLCDEYFSRNPYDQWFKKLDYLISGSSYSYYFPSTEACHLDLIPYATSKKWSDLSPNQKHFLLDKSSLLFGHLLRNSNINYLVLNGSTVIKTFEQISDISYTKELQTNWVLNRKNGKNVNGYSFEGDVNKIGGVKLKQAIKVFGFNHNIQSSFGVTSIVQKSIRDWLSNKIKV